jgi:cysteinyl-tRNA synthetase
MVRLIVSCVMESRLGDLPISFHESQSSFRIALCDSFNTPAALDIIRELVSRTNVCINTRGKNVNVGLIEHIARWVGQMLRMFGLGEGESSEIGWGHAELEGTPVNVIPCQAISFGLADC